ncbi:MAG: aspartate-semialdehyde dehydrogenase [Crenarchaeota archaeon]|nr:aspartate-semialdehyde dehydrogenase [Thermoproteota archaeon]
MADRVKVAVLGATGLVGQVFVKLLSGHPFFEIAYLAASERSAGKRYVEAVNWVLGGDPPGEVADLTVGLVKPDAIPGDVELVFSALPSSVALDVEVGAARRGFTVVSNASPLRLEADVPLIIPEINWDHIRLLEVQRRRRGWRGAIVKNSNCTTAILTLSLKPLLDRFGLEEVFVSTMQAVSGAGYRGVPSVAIIDNIIPFIRNEEEKVMNESRKILGTLRGDHVEPASFRIYATCTRAPVINGHMETVYARLARSASIEDVLAAWEEFRGLEGLPTAPAKPVIVRREADRPQTRLDRDAGGGMSVSVGRYTLYSERLLRYIVLGHNLVRGAAGNTILIAEMMYREGLL